MAADKLLGALGLARRAGALVAGRDAVCDAARGGKARLVLLAQDLAPRTQNAVTAACAPHCRVVPLPRTMQQLQAITNKPAGVLAVTDKNLAALCLGAIPGPTDEEEPI